MKCILEKIKYNNTKLSNIDGDDYILILRFNNYEITFYDYDIDNDYDISNRVIYKLDEFKIEDNKYKLSLLIFMYDSNLLEKVTIISNKINVKVFKKDKIFKEEVLELK